MEALKYIPASALDRRISIRRETRSTDADYNTSEVSSDALVKTVWAKRSNAGSGSNAEHVESSRLTEVDEVHWTIKSPRDFTVTETDYIIGDDGLRYDIERVMPDGRKMYNNIVTKMKR